MNKSANRLYSSIIHPFLFSIYPVLFLFSKNLGRYPSDVLIAPIIIVICFTSLSLSLLKLLLKDIKKSGLIVSLFLLLFFSYEHFYIFLDSIGYIKWYLGANKTFFLVWVIPVLLWSYSIARSSKNFDNLIKIFNIIASILVCFSLVKIGTFYLGKKNTFIKSKPDKEYEEYIKGAPLPDSMNADKLPNIYFILLDAYGREDLNKDIFHYDNKEFIDYLISKGFYVANKSRSNYAHTALALASAMNINYVQDLLDITDINSFDYNPLINIVRDSYIIRFLKRYGYKIVSFSSGVYTTEMMKADIYMAPGWSLNEFVRGLLETTLLHVLDRIVDTKILFTRREINLYMLDHIEDTVKLKGPIFVFAHIILPHPPYVVDENGEDILVEARRHMMPGMIANPIYYRKALTFLNRKLKKMIDRLLAGSDKKPIIVLFGDHGPGVKNPEKSNYREYHEVLNAYYLPNNGSQQLYNEISQVNTFRVIFNYYFGTNFNLLKDESYYSNFFLPYKFIKVERPTLQSQNKIRKNKATHTPIP